MALNPLKVKCRTLWWRGVKHKARGPKLARWTAMIKVKEDKFCTFNYISTSFTVFPTDKELIDEKSCFFSISVTVQYLYITRFSLFV